MLTLLLHTILVRIVLPLLLELEPFLASTADLLRSLLLVLELRSSGTLSRAWRGDERLPILAGGHHFR